MSETNEVSLKQTNPKDAVGTKKAPVSTVSMPFILSVGLAMLEGALKYGRHNYRESGVRLSVYVDAIFRHLAALYEGEWYDPDTKGAKIPHIIKIAACCAVVFDAHLFGKLVDDRPPSHKPGWINEFNKKASDIIDQYPNPKEAFTRGEKLED